MALLEVKNLCTEFKTDQGRVQAVRGVSFELGEKEVLGIVGESGSGKSQTMYSIIGLLAENGVIADGKVIFDGKDISRNQFATKKEYEEMNEHFDKFADTLTKEQFKLFDLYDEKNTLFNDLIFERTYKNGIKTGMLLILELLDFEPTYNY